MASDPSGGFPVQILDWVKFLWYDEPIRFKFSYDVLPGVKLPEKEWIFEKAITLNLTNPAEIRFPPSLKDTSLGLNVYKQRETFSLIQADSNSPRPESRN